MGWLQSTLGWFAALGKRIAAGFGSAVKSVGERAFARMLGGMSYWGSPGGWTQNRTIQADKLRLWPYIAIRAISEEIAGHLPQFAVVRKPEEAARRAKAWQGQRSRFLSRLSRRKALHAGIAEHEELELLDSDHRLPQLLAHPNSLDKCWAQFSTRTDIYLELMGTAYWWVIPDDLGLPAELWVIPSHWVWPGRDSDGNRLWDWYDIRPYGTGAHGQMRLPASEIVQLQYPGAMTPYDGWGALQAGAEWVDIDQSIYASIWASFKQGIHPSIIIELEKDVKDPDEAMIQRMRERLAAQYAGEGNRDAPMVLGPGAKMAQASRPPTEMDYTSSTEQSRDRVLALYRVGKTIAGLTEDVNFSSSLAARANFARYTIKPKLIYRGHILTECIAKRFDPRIIGYYEDPTPDDPQQRNADLQLQASNGCLLQDEMRQEFGREPFQPGDTPLVPSGLQPLPVGDDTVDLASLLNNPQPGEQTAEEGPAPEEVPEEKPTLKPSVGHPSPLEQQRKSGGRLAALLHPEKNGVQHKAADASGHEHAPPGPQGGQFVGGSSGETGDRGDSGGSTRLEEAEARQNALESTQEELWMVNDTFQTSNRSALALADLVETTEAGWDNIFEYGDADTVGAIASVDAAKMNAHLEECFQVCAASTGAVQDGVLEYLKTVDHLDVQEVAKLKQIGDKLVRDAVRANSKVDAGVEDVRTAYEEWSKLPQDSVILTEMDSLEDASGALEQSRDRLIEAVLDLEERITIQPLHDYAEKVLERKARAARREVRQAERVSDEKSPGKRVKAQQHAPAGSPTGGQFVSQGGGSSHAVGDRGDSGGSSWAERDAQRSNRREALDRADMDAWDATTLHAKGGLLQHAHDAYAPGDVVDVAKLREHFDAYHAERLGLHTAVANALKEGGASDKEVARFTQVVNNGKAALDRKAEAYLSQVQKWQDAQAAVTALKDAEPEEPEALDEPELPEEPQGPELSTEYPDKPDVNDYVGDQEGYDVAYAEYETETERLDGEYEAAESKWQEDHDAWDQEVEKIQAGHEKAQEKQQADHDKAVAQWETAMEKADAKADKEYEKTGDLYDAHTDAEVVWDEKISDTLEVLRDKASERLNTEEDGDPEPDEEEEEPDEPVKSSHAVLKERARISLAAISVDKSVKEPQHAPAGTSEGGQFVSTSGSSAHRISGAPTSEHRAAAERYAATSSGLSKETAAEYVEHLSHAMSVLPAGVGREVSESLQKGSVKFHQDLKDLQREAKKLGGKAASGVTGFVHERGMGVDVHLDGGDDPRGTYVHELWHAADNGGYHSDDKGWQAAYKKDILKGKHLLSRYAMTNASEGFAEFGRALAERGADYMAERFPNAMKHLKAKGLL